MTRTVTIVLALVLVAASASAGWFDRGTKGNGDLETRNFDLGDCHAIMLECGLDIDISFGKEQRIALTMDENLFDHYELKERGGRLVVSADDSPKPSRGARLELVLEKLEHIDIQGAGDIRIDDFDGDELLLEIAGAGDIEIDGKVKKLTLKINGAGDIDARELEAERAEVTVNGAGDVEVYASKACDVSINGVGDVDVYGKPEQFEKSINGIGDIDRK